MPNPLLSPIAKGSLSESVYRQLKHKILSREIEPGAALPSERVLTQMLGVNRGAVREAIKRLQQAGLVAVRQGGNHQVLDFADEGGLELLPTLLIDEQGHINATVARSIMALRASLAPDVAASAAEKGGAKLAGELDQVLERMRASSADIEALQGLALDYWGLLVNSGGNIAYRLAFNSMNKTYRSAWKLLTRVLEAEFRDLENLGALAAAVRARDGATARACAVKHVGIGTREMEKALKSYQKVRSGT